MRGDPCNPATCSHSRVVVQQVVGEVMEKVRGVWSEETIMDHINGPLQFWIGFIVLSRLIAREHMYTTWREREREREREGGMFQIKG